MEQLRLLDVEGIMTDRRCCPACGFDYGVLWILIRTSSKFSRIGNRCKKCDAVLTLEGKSASYVNKVNLFLIFAIGFYGFVFSSTYSAVGGFNYLFVFSILILLIIFYLFIIVYLSFFSLVFLKLFPRRFHEVGTISLLKYPQKVLPPVSFFKFG
jgi:hypothetical protein